jgi:glycosyltransferase involved in cell wall biosynthesis
MKILLAVHHELDRNAGAAGVTWRLGQEYEKLGHEVQYYTFDNLPHNLPGLVKSMVFPEFLAGHISAVLRKQAVDVVDASTGDAWVWAKLRRTSNGKCPLLVTRSHGLEHTVHLQNLEEARLGNLHLSWKYPLYHGGFRLWEVASSLRHADLSLFANRLDLEYAVEKFNVDARRARVFANGIPEAFLNLPFDPTPEADDSVVRIAQVSTYISRKGIHYGVPALNAILARHPQAEVSFLGAGCSEAEVLADFDPAVRDRVTVVPRFSHEALPGLLRGHHIKVLPSLSEGFGVAIIEAMAAGLAPLTTTTPGPMEFVREGYNGILVPPRDTQAFEHALERLVTDRRYLDQLRRNAHASAQHYSWERIARDTLGFYDEALRQRRRSQ